MRKGGNITSGFEDNINLSSTFLDKYAAVETAVESLAEVTASVKVALVEDPNVKRVASKDELQKLGFVSQGTGVYKDATHHLWNLSREGEGYAISRVAEEEDILHEKRIASKEVIANQVTVTNDTALGAFFSNLDQSGVYYNKVAEDMSETGYSAVVDVSAEDMSDFTAIAQESGVKTAAKEADDSLEDCKVFSDEAILTGISHYSTMGYTIKEAVNNFIESYELDKKHYEPLINEVLDRYNQ